MKNVTRSLFATGLLLGLVVAALVAPSGVAAQENNESSQNENTQNTNYTYEAQPGDTYAQIARKAIQTYGIENKVNLSGAEIVFAETRMTQEAGSPELNVGQKVEVSKETVKKWADEAQKLDEATEARWNRYVQFVDFNTNNVGEKRSA